MTTPLSELSQNLQELWSAISSTHPRSAEPLPLVANYSGTHLYDSRRGFGRVWSWFYTVVGCVFGDSIKNEKLKSAVNKTTSAFEENVEALTQTATEYRKYLLDIANGKNITEEQALPLKARIVEWNNATRPFMKLLKKHSDSQTHEITHLGLKTLLDNSLGAKSTKAFRQPLAQDLITYQKISDLENHYEPYHILPLPTLKRITQDVVAFADEDAVSLRKWITFLNNSDITEKVLRQGIDGIAQMLWSEQDRMKFHLFLVGPKCLKDLNCTVYKRNDSKLSKRIARLVEGATVHFNRENYVITKVLKTTAKEGSYASFIVTANHINSLLLLGNNKSSLFLEQIFAALKTAPNKCDPPDGIISHNGLYKLITGLTPMMNYPWATTSIYAAEADLPKLKAITDLLDRWIWDKYTPANLEEAQWFFTTDNEVVAIDRLEYNEQNFYPLDRFIAAIAHGNMHVKNYIFTNSKFGEIADTYTTLHQNIRENALASLKPGSAVKLWPESEIRRRVRNRGPVFEEILLKALEVQNAILAQAESSTAT